MRPNKRRTFLLGGLALGLSVGYIFGSLLLTAKAVAPPNATAVQVLKLAVNPPYEIAAPHLSLVQKFSFKLVPDAEACSGTCTGYESKPICKSISDLCGTWSVW